MMYSRDTRGVNGGLQVRADANIVLKVLDTANEELGSTTAQHHRTAAEMTVKKWQA
jgi:hypothetical protein